MLFKHSSLSGPIVSYKENKVLQIGAVFTTLHILHNSQMAPDKLECLSLLSLLFKHSSLSGPIVSYKENKVFQIGAVFTTLHILHNSQMGPISKSFCLWQAFPV